MRSIAVARLRTTAALIAVLVVGFLRASPTTMEAHGQSLYNRGGRSIIVDVSNTSSYKLTSAEEGVLFDLDGDGVAEQIAWTEAGSDVALLALDRNGDGRITSGRELFGNYTLPGATNGFEALRRLATETNSGFKDGFMFALPLAETESTAGPRTTNEHAQSGKCAWPFSKSAPRRRRHGPLPCPVPGAVGALAARAIGAARIPALVGGSASRRAGQHAE